MRGPIACASLIACTALFAPQYATGEESARRTAPRPEPRTTAGWATRAHNNPSIPTKRSVHVPSKEAPRQPPANMSPERPRSAEVTRDGDNPVHVEPSLIGSHTVDSLGEIAMGATADPGCCGSIQAEIDEGAFLLPIWDRGFWPMPPGGLTRRLIPARGFINPDETLAP